MSAPEDQLRMSEPQYPTPQHKLAADQIVRFFARQDGIDGVLLVNSLAPQPP